jgi:hypothetical protein
VVETTDLVFAVDSIPAVIAVTKEPFIIFTSNIMAILGLRALYFLLAAAMTQFRYLKPALAFILTFIGLKMVIEKLFHDPIHTFLHEVMKVGDPEYFLVVASLAIVLAVLVFGVVASIVYNRRTGRTHHQGSRARSGAGRRARRHPECVVNHNLRPRGIINPKHRSNIRALCLPPEEYMSTDRARSTRHARITCPRAAPIASPPWTGNLLYTRPFCAASPQTL